MGEVEPALLILPSMGIRLQGLFLQDFFNCCIVTVVCKVFRIETIHILKCGVGSMEKQELN